MTVNDSVFAMGGQPRLNRVALKTWQEGDDAPSLQVTGQRGVALSVPENPIVAADHLEGLRLPMRAAAPGPQQSVLALRHHEPAGDAVHGVPAEHEPEVMHVGKREARYHTPQPRFTCHHP